METAPRAGMTSKKASAISFLRTARQALLASRFRVAVSRTPSTAPDSADFLASLEMPARGARIFGAVRTGQRVFDHERPRSEVDTDTTVHLTGGGPTQTIRSTGGRYEFRGLAAGSYQVHIDLPQGYTTYSSRRGIEIPNVRACAQENFSLGPDGHIAGRVVGPDGSALKDVAVEVTTPDARPHPVYGLSIESARSDAEGFFDVGNLPPNRYIVGVNLRDLPTKYNPYARILYPGPPNDPHVTELGLGQRADLGTWHMPPPLPIVRVQGVVTRRDGSPVPGVFVGAWDETDNPVERARGAGSATSGSDGRFVLELRKGRTYTFSVRDPQSKSLRISTPRIDTSADLPAVLHIVIPSEGEMPMTDETSSHLPFLRQSARSATVGASRDARRAGIHAASRLTIPSAPTPIAIDAGSHGVRPNSRLAAQRHAAIASTTPMITPTLSSTPDSPSTIRTTLRGSAPSAIRIPISTFRRVTMYDITP